VNSFLALRQEEYHTVTYVSASDRWDEVSSIGDVDDIERGEPVGEREFTPYGLVTEGSGGVQVSTSQNYRPY
jgi:hypothetical protein